MCVWSWGWVKGLREGWDQLWVITGPSEVLSSLIQKAFIYSSQQFSSLLWVLSSFPGAVLTKYHKVGGGKQQTCTLSQFWKVKVLYQGVRRGGLPQKILPCLFPASGIASNPWCSPACSNITPTSASIITQSFYLYPCVLLIRTSVILDYDHPSPVWFHLN